MPEMQEHLRVRARVIWASRISLRDRAELAGIVYRSRFWAAATLLACGLGYRAVQLGIFDGRDPLTESGFAPGLFAAATGLTALVVGRTIRHILDIPLDRDDIEAINRIVVRYTAQPELHKWRDRLVAERDRLMAKQIADDQTW